MSADPPASREPEGPVDSFAPTVVDTGYPANSDDVSDGHLPPGTVLGDYRVLRRIGSGGSGIVYLAQQDRPRRTVALKVLKESARRPDLSRRFELEAEVLGRLQHPGVAQIFQFSPARPGQPPFLAMELVSGPRITDYADAAKLDARQRAALVADIADAVHHAHARGVIHRDLKPANILVTPDGQPKVLDFGVARAVGGDQLLPTVKTEHGQLVGTMGFMSPEQLRANPDDIDARSDVYALGVLLFRILTGQMPHNLDDVSFGEALRLLTEARPTRPGLIDADLRGDIEAVIGRAMALDPATRYQTASSLAADLRKWAAGQPIAPTDDTWEAVGKQLRSYRRGVGIAAVVGTVLLALLAFALVQRGRAVGALQQLSDELGENRLARGRLLAEAGSVPEGERLLWSEFFRQPGVRARWALRELYSRQPVLWTAAAHEGEIRAVVYVDNERRLVTAGIDGRITILDAQTGASLGDRRTGSSPIWAMDASTARQLVVTGALDGALRVWHLPDLQPLGDGPQVEGGVRALALSPDGRRVAATTDAGHVVVWPLDAPTDAREAAIEPGNAWGIAFDGAGRRVAAGLPSGRVRLYDAATLAPIRDLLGHDAASSHVTFSPDGSLIAGGSLDRTVIVWNAETGAVVAKLGGTNGTARGVRFTPDGRTLVVAGWWRIERWDVVTWQRRMPDLGTAESWFDVAISADGKRMAGAGEYGQVRLWDAEASAVQQSWAAHSGAVTGLAVVGARLWSSSQDRRLLALQPGSSSPPLELASTGAARGLVVMPGGTALIAGNAPAVTLRVGDRTQRFGESDMANAAAVLDDDRVVAAMSDSTLAVYRVADGIRERVIPTQRSEAVAMVAAGDSVFVACRDQSVTRLRRSDLAETWSARTVRQAFTLAVSPDQKTVAAGTFLGTVELRDAGTGALRTILAGHIRQVTALAFSASGRWLASAGLDGGVRLWDPATGTLMALIAQRESPATALVFVDEQHLALGWGDGRVELLDLEFFDRHIAGNEAFQRTQR